MTAPEAWTLTVILESPFISKGSDPAGFAVDEALLRDADGSILFPGSQIQGTLHDVLVTIAGRARGSLKALPRWEGRADALIADLFGRRSEERLGGNEPDRKQLIFEDLSASVEGAEENREGRYVRIQVDPELGAVREGHLLTVELPYPIRTPVGFSGTVHYIGGEATADEIESLLKLAFPAVIAIGAHKSAGFGRLTRRPTLSRLRRPSPTPLPAQENQAEMDLVLEVRGPLVVDSERVAPNLYRGSAVIPGGAIKGAVAGALAARSLPESVRSKLDEALASAIFGHALPVPLENDGAIRPERPVVLPLSIARLADSNYGVRDVLLEEGVVLYGSGRQGWKPPVFAIDWKDKDYDAVAGWAREAGLCLMPRLRRQIRTRTAINYATGAAKYEEDEGGALFSYSAVMPRILDDDPSGVETPCVWVARLCRGGACSDVFEQLLTYLADSTLFIGKSKTPTIVKRISTVKAEVDNPVVPVGQDADGSHLYALTLQTPVLLNNIESLRASGGDVAADYETYWNRQRSLGSGLSLVRFFARQRLVGGYQAIRFRANPATYQPWIVTEPGSVFLLKTPAAERAAAEAWLAEKRRTGLPERPSLGQPRWQACPFIPENGYGAFRLNVVDHAGMKRPGRAHLVAALTSRARPC